jgi:hypothetical protein
VNLEPMSLSSIAKPLVRLEWLKTLGKNRANWSGKEDSNLRPLPPEDASPERMARVTVASGGAEVPFGAACSQHVPRRGSNRAFDPCPRAPEPV